jgi:hypothetical protein
MGKTRIFAGSQPTYLPWMGIFEQMMHADVFVICDDFQATFPSWMNRNRIKGPQGELWLTVPVARPHEAPINKVKLFHERSWQKKHLRSIEMCYGKAPYYGAYIERLREIYAKEWEYLGEFAVELIRYFRECLGIRKELLLSSALDVNGQKSSLVIDLCRKTGCNAAYLAAGTRAYIDEEMFRQAGIEIQRQDLEHPVYPQRYGDFVSHLSVLDMLMNCGPESAEIIRAAGERARLAKSAAPVAAG